MISVEDTYPGKAVAADANYPEGSIQNEQIPDVSDDGTPLDELWGNDFEGFKQAVARSAGIVPTPPGNVPETALASQILHSLIEIASGRAYNYDESGAVNAYVLDVQTNQQAPQSLFTGMEAEFTPSIANTAASTINVAALGVKALVDHEGNALRYNDLLTTRSYRIRYDGVSWRLVNSLLLTHGNFAPAAWDSSNSDGEGQTYNLRDGTWTRVGNRCFISGYLDVNSLGTLTTSEQLRIGNLPFTSMTQSETDSSIHFGRGASLALPSVNAISGVITPNTAHVKCYILDAVTGHSIMTVGHLSAGGVLLFSGHYPITGDAL